MNIVITITQDDLRNNDGYVDWDSFASIALKEHKNIFWAALQGVEEAYDMHKSEEMCSECGYHKDDCDCCSKCNSSADTCDCCGECGMTSANCTLCYDCECHSCICEEKEQEEGE